MENLKIGILDDYGQTKSFNIDSQVIKHLYITSISEKVIENCATFNIFFENSADDFESKISKRENLGIVTIKFGQDKFLQFLIAPEMNLKELQLYSNAKLSKELKTIIKQCYDLLKVKTLRDLLK